MVWVASKTRNDPWLCLIEFVYSYRFVIRRDYHEDFFTPGISPFMASSRKQIRHKLNLRIYPCFRPHFQHRFTSRVENFGVFADLASADFFAIELTLLKIPYCCSLFCRGNPSFRNNASPSSRLFAVVVTVICIPNVRLNFSGFISGKILWSLIPIFIFP